MAQSYPASSEALNNLEHNQTSKAKTVVDKPCSMTVVDLSGDADTAVSGGVPAVLLGVYVNVAMSAHAVSIKDGSTAKITLPASTGAGTNINCYSANFATSIVVTPNASSTGTITLFWRAL